MSLHAVCRCLCVASCVAAAVACGASSATTPVGPDPGGQATLSPDVGGGVGADARKVLLPEVIDALRAVLQLEYEARATYESVTERFGPVGPFDKVAEAEIKHVGKLELLFAKRELEAPLPEAFVIPVFDGLAEACADGVLREGALAEAYAGFREEDCPRDVWNVVRHLGDASLENHLPAFTRCADSD